MYRLHVRIKTGLIGEEHMLHTMLNIGYIFFFLCIDSFDVLFRHLKNRKRSLKHDLHERMCGFSFLKGRREDGLDNILVGFFSKNQRS